ncbi:GNAT family N-acetyltransferase [Haladaptatus cibarius]|uniref:GNAT family N-acetyltransferase n=1 Tax=Haladaptatus cibarius TaxID=453847 RepID=UPI0006793A7A|nr:GNAT family N-acetyltransferase [Haladaptatus cibarius]
MNFEVRRLTDHGAVCAGIDCWNRTYPDFSLPNRLVAQNIFAPFDGLDVTAWGAFSENTLVGVVVGKRLVEQIPDYDGSEQGWVSLFAVDSTVEDAAVADELVETVERTMANRGVSNLRVGGDPGQFLPGLPTAFTDLRETLTNHGFESRGTVHDLRGDIAAFDAPERITRVGESWPNLTVERVGADVDPLYSFLADQFPGRWRYEAENVCRVPGGGDDYWLLRHDGESVGFARTNTPDGGYRGANVNWAARLNGATCGIGPLGVHESYRGRSWGLWMIASIVERYRDAGYERMSIDWTGLLEYYRKLGFEPWIEYETLTKELET